MEVEACSLLEKKLKEDKLITFQALKIAVLLL